VDPWSLDARSPKRQGSVHAFQPPVVTTIRLLRVPYTVGDERQGASGGPARVVAAGIARRLAAKGVSVSLGRVERGAPYRDSASASRAVNAALAAEVRVAETVGQLPVVVAGSCDACLGVLGGLARAGLGVVWVDAHADFNTPESTVSGFFPGMSAAIVAGHCYGAFWGGIGDNTPIPEEAMVMLGIRDLSPEAEADRLERSSIAVVPWRAGKPAGDVAGALSRLASRVQEVYLHVDLDGLDPTIAPGIVDAPVPGGLSMVELEQVISATAARFRIRAVAVTTFDPTLDRDDKTLRAVLGILELVGECASEQTARAPHHRR
jgi:arginase